MSLVQNPILKGFNPDPSILRVGEDYYIATSTFEWFPGVQIHHSKDLVNWELIAHPLQRVSQLDMAGTPNSTGVWAPCLSYCDGIFYLIYTNVKNSTGHKDTPNYLVTTRDIAGDWSEPIYLNRSGFDPSLFHDDDGRKWLVNMKWSSMPGKNAFDGILLQEFDPELKKLVGPVKNIYRGSSLGLTEGPHLYKRKGYYYLMVAEGGTGYEHAVTLARSENLEGPYETHPMENILTGDVQQMYTTLQKAGHASIVDDPDGNWYMVHLCGRPVPETNRCILGRETSIQKVVWKEDDWLYMENGTRTPDYSIEVPYTAAFKKPEPFIDDFNSSKLDIHWNTLRVPASERLLSLTARDGYLRLYGRESLNSCYEQSLIARRQQSFIYSAETLMVFTPKTSQHMAGLTAYYNTINYYYLRFTKDDDTGKYCLGVVANMNNDFRESMHINDYVTFDKPLPLELKVEVNYRDLQFYYKLPNSEFTKIGPVYDASILSDDFTGEKELAFTGAYVGLCCQDLAYGGNYADFEYFKYFERDQ